MDLSALVAAGLLPAELGGKQVSTLPPFADVATPLAVRAGGRQGPCPLCYLHEDVAHLVFYANESEYREKYSTPPYSSPRETSTRPIDNFPLEFLCHWPQKCPIAKARIKQMVAAQPALKVHLGCCLSDSAFTSMLNAARPDMFRTGGKGKGRGGGGRGGSRGGRASGGGD